MMPNESVAAENASAQSTVGLVAPQEPDHEPTHEPALEPTEEIHAEETLRPRSPRAPVPYATLALTAAVIFLIAEGVAIYLANTGQPASASVIAQILVVATVVSFGLAVFATVRGPRRRRAIAAMIVSVIANPLILLQVLTFFGSL